MAPFDAALLASFLVILTPILVAATGELVSQRTGVLNIGLEGMVLSGAFGGFVGAAETGSVVAGFAVGLCFGLLVGVVMALFSIEARTDQIVVGIGINLVVIGLTSFLYAQFFSEYASRPLDATLGTLDIPLLSDLGGVGEALFARDVFVYMSFALLGFVAWALTRTTWGIGIRAAGESPVAADAAGVSVRAVRWTGTLTAAGLAGLAGAYLSVGELGVFRDEMTAGRGFLALTAVLFGRWHPMGVLGACGLFAFADALQLRLQGYGVVPDSVWFVAAIMVVGGLGYSVIKKRSWELSSWLLLGSGIAFAVLGAVGVHIDLPTYFWLGSPFVLALAALAAAGRRRTAMPAKLAVPFTRE